MSDATDLAILAALEKINAKLDALPTAASGDEPDPAAVAEYEANERRAAAGAAAAHDAWALQTSRDVIEFPAPPPELKQRRHEFATHTLQLNRAREPQDDTDWEAAYAVGGPLWLHAYSRDIMVGYSIPVRQQMIQEVEQYDEQAAAELGRDIMRDVNDPPGS